MLCSFIDAKMIWAIITFLVMFMTGSHTVDFCYDESFCDPYAWGDAFPSCHPILEEHHSPINLDHHMTRNESLEALRLDGFHAVHTGHWKLKNNGHSVVLEVGNGMSVSGGGLPGTYHTIQLHFHWGSLNTNGSEHTVDRHRYPMEMHIVNMKSSHPNLTSALDDPTGLAVLAFFIDLYYIENVHFGRISRLLPSIAYKGQTATVKPFPLIGLLPESHLSQYYRYHGSLTTPPCSQAVIWTMYEVPTYISWSQFEQFVTGIFSTEADEEFVAHLHDNFRHIHPTFSRSVYASKDANLLTATANHLYSPALSILLLQLTLTVGLIYGL
ncbi:carbonic anhydrase 15 [Salvelinus sp. IW2-2015]|uniref:carbonic anhydrase 15 n=1 Tax=Salvelinus sp. IW2-2015 TaxID=2691554 RepID=UPI000CDFEFBE|nr:carbonic anhydrase 4 [Salvelinus alpinus]